MMKMDYCQFMKDNSIFLAIIHEFGLIDLDVHFIGVDHLFSTQVGSLDSDWQGKSTFADLVHVQNKGAYIRKARNSAKENKEGLHLLLFRNDTHTKYFDKIIQSAKAIYFFNKPYALVVFQGETQGIPLIYRMETIDTDLVRLHFLSRTLICDF